jgi:hypothetical protein
LLRRNAPSCTPLTRKSLRGIFVTDEKLLWEQLSNMRKRGAKFVPIGRSQINIPLPYLIVVMLPALSAYGVSAATGGLDKTLRKTNAG